MEPDTQILQMNTIAVDFLRMLGQVPNDDGPFERDVDTFLQQTNVIDFMDFTDLSQTPYDKFTQFVDAETFHRLIPFIIDMKLLVQYIDDFADFDALLKQAHQKTDSAWAKVMDEEKEHTRRFQRYCSTYLDDEYEIYRESSENDGTHSIVGSIASRKSRGSHGMGKHTRPGARTRTKTAIKGDEISIASTIRSKQAEHEAKESRLKTVTRDNTTPKKETTFPTTVTVTSTKSHLSQHTKEMLEEANYQSAMSALNESFLTRPPMKLISRKDLHHKIRWDGQDKTFLLFKKQYEAYLIASQQDYATDPDFRRLFIAQDKNYADMCRKYKVAPAQVLSDTKQQFGALSMACSAGNDDGQRFLGLYPRDGIRVWHAMVHWFQYGGSVETVLGQLEASLQTEYTDNYSGGIIGYINMMANTYARQRQVITDNPDCDIHNPTDIMKMRHIKAKLQGTTYALGVHQD
jgi:hypothetical protein